MGVSRSLDRSVYQRSGRLVSILHTSGWTSQLVMSQWHREGMIFKCLVPANHTHNRWHDMSPLSIIFICVVFILFLNVYALVTYASMPSRDRQPCVYCPFIEVALSHSNIRTFIKPPLIAKTHSSFNEVTWHCCSRHRN